MSSVRVLEVVVKRPLLRPRMSATRKLNGPLRVDTSLTLRSEADVRGNVCARGAPASQNGHFRSLQSRGT